MRDNSKFWLIFPENTEFFSPIKDLDDRFGTLIPSLTLECFLQVDINDFCKEAYDR